MTLLRVIGGLYLLSGFWCLLRPMLAAGFLDFEFVSDAGLAEFVSVYGGLQIGIGVAMWWVPRDDQAQQLAAVRFAALVSCGLLAARLFALTAVAVTGALVAMAALEAVLAGALIWHWRKCSKSDV